ncbi:unnamed protein product [Polarella glacialis]|uniref:Uncharacterized protein n=1 Tax=Polarella glacialis TaxID=89957 RepID=A0A813G7V6_POLGL|nr:unnamed protein product [Polarella glacialis]
MLWRDMVQAGTKEVHAEVEVLAVSQQRQHTMASNNATRRNQEDRRSRSKTIGLQFVQGCLTSAKFSTVFIIFQVFHSMYDFVWTSLALQRRPDSPVRCFTLVQRTHLSARVQDVAQARFPSTLLARLQDAANQEADFQHW